MFRWVRIGPADSLAAVGSRRCTILLPRRVALQVLWRKQACEGEPNRNFIHWAPLTELTDPFDFRFASHLTGFMKPEAAAYEHVIDTLGVRAGDVHFFDDLAANVDAARAIGMNAFLAQDPGEVKSMLRQLSLLP